MGHTCPKIPAQRQRLITKGKVRTLKSFSTPYLDLTQFQESIPLPYNKRLFFYFEGAQESIPRNRFRKPM